MSKTSSYQITHSLDIGDTLYFITSSKMYGFIQSTMFVDDVMGGTACGIASNLVSTEDSVSGQFIEETEVDYAEFYPEDNDYENLRLYMVRTNKGQLLTAEPGGSIFVTIKEGRSL